jgi:hypothetical protein
VRTVFLLEKLEGRRPLGRAWRRWEGNIKVDTKEIGLHGVHWILFLAQNVIMKFLCSIKSAGI